MLAISLSKRGQESKSRKKGWEPECKIREAEDWDPPCPPPPTELYIVYTFRQQCKEQNRLSNAY